MPNSNQLFFSTSPPFTTGWVRLGDPKRSWCIRFFHFSHSLGHCCLPTLLVCHLQLSHFFSGFILFHNGQWGRSFPNAIRWILCATHLVCCRSDLGSFQARIVDSHCASVFFLPRFLHVKWPTALPTVHANQVVTKKILSRISLGNCTFLRLVSKCRV